MEEKPTPVFLGFDLAGAKDIYIETLHKPCPYCKNRIQYPLILNERDAEFLQSIMFAVEETLKEFSGPLHREFIKNLSEKLNEGKSKNENRSIENNRQP